MTGGGDAVGFDGRVAVVTGGARGIGRAHAVTLARRGAAVVVADPGVAVDGQPTEEDPGADVRAEIEGQGGVVVALDTGVTDEVSATAVVDAAMTEFGRVDIVVNSAGIVRDRTVAKIDASEVADLMAVHLVGPIFLARAAWGPMRDQGYGRILNTTSNAGLFGNFGQGAYGAAKAAVVGFTKVLAQEGRRYGIHANAIAPIAGTRMTATPLGDLYELFPASDVAEVAAWLVHETCTATGDVYSVGGGRVARVAQLLGVGVEFGAMSAEAVRDRFGDVREVTPGGFEPSAAMDEVADICRRRGWVTEQG